MTFPDLETLVEQMWNDFDDLIELERHLVKNCGFKRKFVKRMIYKIAKEKTK